MKYVVTGYHMLFQSPTLLPLQTNVDCHQNDSVTMTLTLHQGGGGRGNLLCSIVILLASQEYWPGLQFFLGAYFYAPKTFVSPNNGIIEVMQAVARCSDSGGFAYVISVK